MAENETDFGMWFVGIVTFVVFVLMFVSVGLSFRLWFRLRKVTEPQFESLKDLVKTVSTIYIILLVLYFGEYVRFNWQDGWVFPTVERALKPFVSGPLWFFLLLFVVWIILMVASFTVKTDGTTNIEKINKQIDNLSPEKKDEYKKVLDEFTAWNSVSYAFAIIIFIIVVIAVSSA